MRWLYSFHMPLFFISSGVLYGLRRDAGKALRYGLRNKVKTLLLPYLIWATIYQVFLSALATIGGKNAGEAFGYYLPMVLQITGTAMWFLPVMFMAIALFFVMIHCGRFGPVMALAYMIAGIFAPEVGRVLPVILRACVGAGFIAIGYYGTCIFDKGIPPIGVFALAILQIFAAISHGTVSLASRSFGNPVLYILISCLGTLWIYGAGRCIGTNGLAMRLLGYWGRNSIKVLCFHEFVLQILRIADYKWFADSLVRLGWAEGLGVASMIMLILTITMPVINILLNWSFGLKRE